MKMRKKLLEVEVERWNDGSIMEIKSFMRGRTRHGLEVRLNGGDVVSWIETKDGELHGRELHWSKGKLISHEEFHCGKLCGKTLRWDEDGRLESSISYHDFMPHGPLRQWLNGVLVRESMFERGRLSGITRAFNMRGELELFQVWEKGRLIEERKEGFTDEDLSYGMEVLSSRELRSTWMETWDEHFEEIYEIKLLSHCQAGRRDGKREGNLSSKEILR